MDQSPDVLVETVRAKRVAIDNDLELLRTRLAAVDPRRRLDPAKLGRTALPALAAGAAIWFWTRRRRRVATLDQLLTHGLADLYGMEQQLLPALERMRARAWNEDLEAAFAQHCAETAGQLDRLQRVFRAVGKRPRGTRRGTLTAIIADGDALLSRKVDRDVRDAWLIATAQRIEHLEIASYGTARTYAAMLGFTHAAQLLQQSLDEERATDEKLTHLAERFVNPKAVDHAPAGGRRRPRRRAPRRMRRPAATTDPVF